MEPVTPSEDRPVHAETPTDTQTETRNGPQTDMHIELVDANHNVISRASIPASAFPVTMRIVENGRHAVPSGHVRPSQRPQGTMQPPLPAMPLSSFLMRLASPIWSGLLIAGAGILVLANTYFTTYGRAIGNTVMGVTLGVVFTLCTVAAIWAMYGRVARGEPRFAAHLAWICLALILFIALSSLSSFLAFLFPAAHAVGMLLGCLLFVLFAGWLYGHLSMASRMRRERKIVAVVAITAGFAVLAGIGSTLLEEEFLSPIHYDTSVYPLDSRWVPASSVERFTGSLEDIEQKIVDEIAAENDSTVTTP